MVPHLHRIEVGGFTKVSAQHYLEDGGKSGREFPYNLISSGQESWNIWTETQSNQSFVMLEFAKPLSFAAVGLKSANEADTRNPDEVRISVFNNETQSWNLLNLLSINFHGNTCKTLQYPGVAAENVTSIIFDFKNNKCAMI